MHSFRLGYVQCLGKRLALNLIELIHLILIKVQIEAKHWSGRIFDKQEVVNNL